MEMAASIKISQHIYIKKNLIQVLWIDQIIHNRAIEVFLEKKEPKDLSFFDCIDFALIESAGIERAFSFTGLKTLVFS